jgi:hypothetical protein
MLFALLLVGCWRLPSDFASLPLDRQVDQYIKYLHSAGHPNQVARSHISWHGWVAADLMAEYLSHRRKDLPDFEAIEIINAVQVRGCSLHGTASEEALKEALGRFPQGSLERNATQGALEAIQKDLKFTASRYDALKGGPCEDLHQRPPSRNPRAKTP